MLRYLTRKEIDAGRWDACIDGAATPLVYARSEYLDAMAPHWNAVVSDDYQAVMPLPFKIKWGLRYVTMPAFIQQLGIFSAGPTSSELRQQCMALAEKRFRFGDYHFHHGHPEPRFRPRNNFVLSLHAGYDTIRAHYRQDLQKNLARAQKFSLDFRAATDVAEVIRLYRSLYHQRQPSITDADYRNFEKLCRQLQQRKQVVLRAVYDGRQLLATALCLKDHQRLYLLMSATTGEGRKKGANHFLIDRLVHEFSGTDMILDFEGSEVPGIAHFYKNFGTQLQPYFFHRWNHLPWPLSMLKKFKR